MAKDKTAGLKELPPDAQAEAPAATGPALTPRVIPEFRGQDVNNLNEGPKTFPTRLADYPAEQAAGWGRYKVIGRVPHSAAFPPTYVLAPDVPAAERAYLGHHASGYVLAQDERFVCASKRMDD